MLEKCFFNLRLRNINEQQLNTIIKDIYNLCPSAIEDSDNDKDFIYISVNKLSKEDFRYINKKMKDFIKEKSQQILQNQNK